MAMLQPPIGSSWQFEAGKATASVASTATAEDTVQGSAGELKQGTWLFAVDDGEVGIVISGEFSYEEAGVRRNYLRLVRMADPTHSSTYATALDDASAVKFDASVSSLDNLGFNDDISDHWHVFAHGHHYITYSHADSSSTPPTPRALAILCLDTSFNIVGNVLVFAGADSPYYGSGPLYSESSADSGLFGAAEFRTNDHFLVAQSGGVAIGIRLQTPGADEVPGSAGHFVMRLNWDLTKRSCSAFHPEKEPSVLDHANAASALSRATVRGSGAFEFYSEISDTYDVIAPDTISVDRAGRHGTTLTISRWLARSEAVKHSLSRHDRDNSDVARAAPELLQFSGPSHELANPSRAIAVRPAAIPVGLSLRTHAPTTAVTPPWEAFGDENLLTIF